MFNAVGTDAECLAFCTYCRWVCEKTAGIQAQARSQVCCCCELLFAHCPRALGLVSIPFKLCLCLSLTVCIAVVSAIWPAMFGLRFEWGLSGTPGVTKANAICLGLTQNSGHICVQLPLLFTLVQLSATSLQVEHAECACNCRPTAVPNVTSPGWISSPGHSCYFESHCICALQIPKVLGVACTTQIFFFCGFSTLACSARACTFIDLPLHLMYMITWSLDLRSQRNLFLCNSQLYSKWQLHVPDHTEWQLIDLSVNLVETATFGGLCDTSGHNTYIKINFGSSGV